MATGVQLATAAHLAVARFGRIDTWVSNAGVAIYGKLADTPDDEHERMFRTNYFGAVHSATIALQHLRERGGALLVVASIAADLPSPLLGAYAASKHAVKAYVESLRMELEADEVPVSVALIKPSGMATPIAEHAANHMTGEAMVPPPAYDPRLVAEAILNCAEHARREVTVGGAGRLQALLGAHFPRLLDRLAPLLMPLVEARSEPKTPGNSLWTPGEDGRISPEGENGLRHSPYTWSRLHPAATAGIVAGAAALAYAVATRRNSSEADDPA